MFGQIARQTNFVQIQLGFGNGLGLVHALHMNGGGGNVFQHRHVGPQIEVLEHHRQTGTQAFELLFVYRNQLIRFRVQTGFQFLALDDDTAGVRRFQKIDATQESTFTGTAGTDQADDIARLCAQRDALEYFQGAIAFVNVFDEQVGHGKRYRIENKKDRRDAEERITAQTGREANHCACGFPVQICGSKRIYACFWVYDAVFPVALTGLGIAR